MPTHARLALELAPQALGVGGCQGAEFVVAVQEVQDGAFGEDDPAAGKFVVDFGDAAVLDVPQATDQGEHVQAELVVGQREVRLGLGVIGLAVAATGPVVAAADADSKTGDAVQVGRCGS